MKKEKIIINIENLNDLEKYKKIGINNFLFAVDYFSIGYKSFDLKTINNLDCNKFLLINRILNTTDIEKLKEIKQDLEKFEYIIFEDIAVYNILKDTNIKLIWNQTHFATNYSSINYWLELVNNVVISNELTKEEVKDIIDKSNKNIILNVFGKNPIMYSRRTLLSNFNQKFKIENKKETILNEGITKNQFHALENDFGTFIKNNTHFNIINYLENFNKDKISFYLIYPDSLSFEEILNYINGNNNENTNDGFMNKKTIYKLGEKK